MKTHCQSRSLLIASLLICTFFLAQCGSDSNSSPDIDPLTGCVLSTLAGGSYNFSVNVVEDLSCGGFFSQVQTQIEANQPYPMDLPSAADLSGGSKQVDLVLPLVGQVTLDMTVVDQQVIAVPNPNPITVVVPTALGDITITASLEAQICPTDANSVTIQLIIDTENVDPNYLFFTLPCRFVLKLTGSLV